MSKVTIQGDANGTGIFTIASPNSNTDRTLVLPDEAGTVLTTAGVPASAMPAGSVLQVVHFLTSDQGSVSVTTADTALSPDIFKTITPVGDGSNFLITVRWAGESTYGFQWSSNVNILRDGVRINAPGTLNYQGLGSLVLTYYGNDDNSTPDMLNFSTLDTTGSTAGTPITFRLVMAGASTATVWTNRCFGGTTGSGYETFSTEMIIMEIAG